MFKKSIALFLTVIILATIPMAPNSFAENGGDDKQMSFEEQLLAKYSDIELKNKSEVRWWMASAMHTDETIIAELKAMHQAGFSGVELCQLKDSAVRADVYGYGSDQWEHDVKLILDTALDLGMSVSLTSGAGWSGANVPGIDPDSDKANQCVVLLTEDVAAGKSRTGAIPTNANLREKAKLLGAFAVPKTTTVDLKQEYRIIENAEGLDLTEFTIDCDFILDEDDTGLCFGVKDANAFIYWQINANYKADQVWLRPHVQNNGWKSTTNVNITDVVGADIIGKKIHMTLHVKDGVVSCSFDGKPIADYVIPATAFKSGSEFTLGKLGFRHYVSTTEGLQSLARYDDIVVRDAIGKVVKSYDFSGEDTGFSCQAGGVRIVDGMLSLGEKFQTFDTPSLIVDSEYRSVQNKAVTSDPKSFTIDADFVLSEGTTGTSICFGSKKDNSEFMMWQINTKVGGDSVLLRPHSRVGNKWTVLTEEDISKTLGHTTSTIIGKKVHITIEVVDGKTVNTYFDNKLASAFDLPDNSPKDENGDFTFGNLLFRHCTSSSHSNQDLAEWDNIVVKDDQGNTIFAEDFENTDVCGFETGVGAVVKNGTFVVGVRQPEITSGENIFEGEGIIDLSDLIKDGTLDWTAPLDRNYRIMYYYKQGTAQTVAPAVEPSYIINYFDRQGVEALKEYLSSDVFNDPTLNEKIKNGDVQIFMDSLEYTYGKGITSWTNDFREEFIKRKGYDVLPYTFLAYAAPGTSIWAWSDNADLLGKYTLTDKVLTKQILNDIYDVQTELYMEEFLTPFKEWLNSMGIKLRAQISYGRNLEISEPIAAVDYPEAENRNQRNQVDMYRLWSGGAHLQNKVLSSETGGLGNSQYTYTYQTHLQEAYALYASGYNRIVWHIWAAEYAPDATWPGYEAGSGYEQYYKFGTREPSYSEYAEFNEHLGRVQKLLREGKAGVDIGMLYTKYGQHMVYATNKDWMHTHQTMFFPSAVLQENGYSYDYLASDLLKADGVYFDKETKTLELAGYKALVLWQSDLSVSGAETVLKLAKEGLPIVIVNGAAVKSPYASDTAAQLAAVITDLKALDNVKTVETADDVLTALQQLGVAPYVGFSKPNQQLLLQTRRNGDDRYVFAYNYCDDSLHNVLNTEHGDTITTTMQADGTYVPYYIDAWTGEVHKVASYRHNNGKTEFEITLKYGDVALYALEAVQNETLHTTSFAPVYEQYDTLIYRATQSGEYSFSLSNGCQPQGEVSVPAAFDISNWNLRVESYTPSDEIISRTETVLGVTTTEYAVKTQKTNIETTLSTLKTWDDIEAIGKDVSGKGYYSATFVWDGQADGAYLDFGKLTQSMQVQINGVKTNNVNMNLPIIDISSLLKIGENTIEIVYSSNLNNVQINRGIIKEGTVPSNFLGYDTKYESYGLQQATIVPYMNVALAEHVAGELKEAIKPTCSNKGTGYKDCIYCGETIVKDVEIPATGEHSWDKGKVTKEPTTSKEGVKTFTCTVCGATKTEKVAKLPAEEEKEQPKVNFTDVKKKDFYYDAVQWAVANGVTTGASPTTFEPNSSCTRAQAVTFLWRAAGQPTAKNGKNPFVDVKKSDYYYKAVLWAAENGVTSGTSATKFSPNDVCTRGQIVTFLWRAQSGKKVSAKNPFSDVKKSDFYYNAVLWAVKNGVTTGTSSTTFGPAENCTRGQIVTFLYRALV